MAAVSIPTPRSSAAERSGIPPYHDSERNPHAQRRDSRGGKRTIERPQGRRRIIYVISDGKEYGSKATYKDVPQYLQTNKIAVYGTPVGDSARWGEGYVSRLHLPFTMYDNRSAGYVQPTGGILDSEGNLNGIERSYAQVAEQARNQYTLVYSAISLFDSKYRKIEVRVDRPSVEVVAKKGYYASGQDYKRWLIRGHGRL